MKFILTLLCSITISLSASAQWWHIRLTKPVRLPLIEQVNEKSLVAIPVIKYTPRSCWIDPISFYTQSDYALELQEARVMKIAQHNMRFRVYADASYNFSDLAKLYVQQNRLSEAKWYFLQSNNISRQQNDDKHTIENLLALAMIKANMGDVVLAQQDLAEAKQIANTRGYLINVAQIDTEIKYIQENRSSASKTDLRYASTAFDVDKKARKDKKTD